MIEVTEVSIAELRAALESGQTTAVELVQAYLARIDAYDGADTATQLNAVVVRNPEALKEAQASDARRARGAGPRPALAPPLRRPGAGLLHRGAADPAARPPPDRTERPAGGRAGAGRRGMPRSGATASWWPTCACWTRNHRAVTW